MLATVRKGQSWRVQITAPNGSVRLFGRFYSEKECARMDSVVTQHTKMAVQSNSRNWITAPLPAGVSYPFSSGTAKRASNCCSRSCRICQIRPSTKPIAIATDISKSISSTKVIGMFLSGPYHYVAEQRLPDRFAATLVNRAGDGRRERGPIPRQTRAAGSGAFPISSSADFIRRKIH